MEEEFDEYDDESEETDSEDDPVIIKKPIKEIQKPKEVTPKITRTNLKYENQELVDRVDSIAEKILREQGKNKYRDHFFPLLIDALELKCGVEIGVDKAEFSVHILSKSKIGRYYCVDIWMDNFGSDCKPGFYDKDGNKRFLEAKKKLEPFAGTFEVMRMTSVEASKQFTDNTVDFCYIDGDHSLSGIYEDIKAWTPKVKIGGVLGFHDFKDGPRSGITDFWGRQLDYKIQTVVEHYCNKYGYKLNVIGGRILSAWFVKNREPK